MAVAQATHVGRRRVIYGTNVILQVLVVLAVVVAAMYLTRDRWQIDVTSSGINSLSPRTQQLLHNLKQDVRITAVYTVLSQYDELAQKRRDAVQSLLRLYESTGGRHITADVIDPMKDRGRFVAVLQRLTQKPEYANSAKGHVAALDAFTPLDARVQSVIDQHMQTIQAALAGDPALQQSVLAEVAQQLGRLGEQTGNINTTIKDLVGQEIPLYGKAVDELRTYLQALTSWSNAIDDWVAKKSSSAKVPAGARDAITQLNSDLAAVMPDVNALLKQIADLKPPKLEELAQKLNRWPNNPPIVVETDEAAEVLTFAEVWPFRNDQSAPPPADGDTREFKGEEAISSAILRLTQKERTAVIFTRWGGVSPITPDFSQFNPQTREMPHAPFGMLNKLLQDENFITLDWDVQTQPEPPDPNGAARKVYVILPPAPPPQSDPRNPAPTPGISPDDIAKVEKAIGTSGLALFLTGASDQAVGGSGTYEYADYLRDTWGLDVQFRQIVMAFAPSPDSPDLYMPRRPPVILATGDRTMGLRLGDSAITEPLGGSTVGLYAACPILETEKAPEGVKRTVLMRVADTKDVWAVSDLPTLATDLRANRGTQPATNDRRPPFPVAVAAEHGQQRVVVIASVPFAADDMLQAPGGYAVVGGNLVAYPAYPGNADLFINSIHWLTGNADRISVGARHTQVPRLDKLQEGFWLDFWHVFLVGIWPGVMLLIGGGVWLFRRR